MQKRLSERLAAAHTAEGTSDLPAPRSSPWEETRGCCFSTQQQLLCQHAPLRSPVPKALCSPAHTICFPSRSLVQLPSALLKHLVRTPRCSNPEPRVHQAAATAPVHSRDGHGSRRRREPAPSSVSRCSPPHVTTIQHSKVQKHVSISPWHSEHLSRSLSPSY